MLVVGLIRSGVFNSILFVVGHIMILFVVFLCSGFRSSLSPSFCFITIMCFGAVAKPPLDLTYHISAICFPVTTNLITT